MLMLIIVKLTRTLYKLFNENRHSNLLCKDIDIHLESQSGVLQTQEKNVNQSVRLTVIISHFSLVFFYSLATISRVGISVLIWLICYWFHKLTYSWHLDKIRIVIVFD